MRWWRAGKRPEERVPEPDASPKSQREPDSPQKLDGLLALQRNVGNQAVQRIVPSSEGEAIGAGEREALESSFGQDLTHVRVHRDAEAGELAAAADARAFAVGRDIYFASGAYGLGTLAHEVGHVIQQEEAVSASAVENAALEHEADAAASAVLSGHAAGVSRVAAAPTLQRQPAAGSQGASLKLLPTDSLTLDGFAIDSSLLASGHIGKLDEFAKRLKSMLSAAPDSIVTIVGFADAPGTEAHNPVVGLHRAEAVRDYLVARGISGNQLHVASLGETAPSIPGKGYESRNRRVVIDVVERSFFKPPVASATPVAPAPTAPTKPVDLTYHPDTHLPSAEEEMEADARRNEAIWKTVQTLREREQSPQGTSAADLFGRVAREAAKKLGFPPWVQERAESLAQDLPSKGAQTVSDQIAGDKSLDANAKNGVKAILDALMRTKIR